MTYLIPIVNRARERIQRTRPELTPVLLVLQEELQEEQDRQFETAQLKLEDGTPRSFMVLCNMAAAVTFDFRTIMAQVVEHYPERHAEFAQVLASALGVEDLPGAAEFLASAADPAKIEDSLKVLAGFQSPADLGETVDGIPNVVPDGDPARDSPDEPPAQP